jgi:argininosuccinate lyase
VNKDLDLRTLSREDLRAFHPDFPADASELLSLERAIEARNLVGGPARANVETELAAANRLILERREALAREGNER